MEAWRKDLSRNLLLGFIEDTISEDPKDDDVALMHAAGGLDLMEAVFGHMRESGGPATLF